MVGLKDAISTDIFEFLPDATFVIDTAGVVIAWNRAVEELTGVPAAEMVGRGDYEYALPFYGERRPVLADLVFLGEEELAEKYDFIERDGDTLVADVFVPAFNGGSYLWAKARPLHGTDGRIVGAVETVRDIGDRKRAEAEAERSRRRLEETIAFLPDPTMVIDTGGVVTAWNRAMEELTGVPATEMVGRGDHEYALPFYGRRQPVLADLVFLSEEELAERYDSIERRGRTLVVDVFVPEWRGGGYLWAKAGPLYDEQGNLTGAIETVRDITERRELEERLARSNAELEIAREIQQSFLPEVIPTLEGYEIAGRSLMAKEVGGDFFDAIPFEVMSLGDESLGLMIADVAGKGVPAALFMALSRVVVRVNARVHDDPARVIAHANDVIAEDATAGMFVTLFYGVLSRATRTLTYVNAGHNPPLVVRADGSVGWLPRTGIALGAVRGRPYGQEQVVISPGDVAVLYTDGVTEAMECHNQMYGEERLLQVVRDNAGRSSEEILEAVFGGVDEFCAGEPQFDDITLMVIKGV
jgi:PAS domain S-box-containing protein